MITGVGNRGKLSKYSPFINILQKLIDQTSALVEEMLFYYRQPQIALPFKTTPTSWTVTRTCDQWCEFFLATRNYVQSVQKKGWNDGLFCVILLFVMVMSVVFPFYLLLRPLQNMQCLSLGSFWKTIQVKSVLNDASTEPELIETETNLNLALYGG